MNCPACGTAMTEIAAGDVKVQACKGGKAKLESARRVARIFKFLCPSYYIPSKQAWGAF